MLKMCGAMKKQAYGVFILSIKLLFVLDMYEFAYPLVGKSFIGTRLI